MTTFHMDHIDGSRLWLIAKEFQTTLRWVRSNIKIVAPREAHADLMDQLHQDSMDDHMSKLSEQHEHVMSMTMLRWGDADEALLMHTYMFAWFQEVARVGSEKRVHIGAV